jgi:hypothetical protein
MQMEFYPAGDSEQNRGDFSALFLWTDVQSRFGEGG